MLSVLRNNTAIFSHNLASLLVMLEENCFNLSCNWCCDMFQAKKKKYQSTAQGLIFFLLFIVFSLPFSLLLHPMLQSNKISNSNEEIRSA